MSVRNKCIDIHLLTNCTDYSDKYLTFIDNCASAGISHLQLRQKNWQFHKLLSFGKELKSILSQYQIPLIINDNLRLALELDADGIHLGQEDGSVAQARQELGADKIIGLSIESNAELIIANQLTSINYVAASAVFTSKTKQNLKKIWGLGGLQEVCSLSKYPVVAIGGIACENIQQVVQAGVAGIAVISAVHDADDPYQYIQQLLSLSSGELK